MSRILRDTTYKAIRRFVDRRDAKSRMNTTFPTSQGRNYLTEPMFADADGGGYYTKLYCEDAENPLAIDYKRFKTEIVKAQHYGAKEWHRFNIDAPAAVPYAITGADFFNARGNHAIEFRCNGRVFPMRNLVSERFYYLPVREKAEFAFRSEYDLIIGTPLPLMQGKPHKRKLVLVLFVDNFGWDIVERISFEDTLPNIARFFSKGLVFDNCFVNSNWTLPSVSTIFSGRPLADHMMFHPRKDLVVGTGYPLISELFQSDGYLTFQACGNWRKSPRYGYAKGFDRTVYRNQLSLSDALDAVNSHLRAFPERDSFVWASVFDLHHPMALIPDIAVQMETPLTGHDYHAEDEKSPFQLEHNAARTLRYIEELKRIDFQLGPLFERIEATYEDDEFVVALVSDHGTTFLTDNSKPLARERCHSAFMIRGGGVPAGRSDELFQTMDIMPTLLQICGIPFKGDNEGRLPQVLGGPPARRHVYSEILFPGGPYTAAVRDEEFEFVLETASLIDDDGRFDLDPHTASLFHNRDHITDVASMYPDKYSHFEQIVVDHLSHHKAQ